MSSSLQRARPQMTEPFTCLGDFAHGLEIAGRGDRKAGLDDVDAQVDQRLGHFHLLGQVHARPGRLLAVAERGVEDTNIALAHDCVPVWGGFVRCYLRSMLGWPTRSRPGQHQPRPANCGTSTGPRSTRRPVRVVSRWTSSRSSTLPRPISQGQRPTKKPQGVCPGVRVVHISACRRTPATSAPEAPKATAAKGSSKWP